MASHLHGNWSKYLLKEDHHTVTVHPGNKWKPVESLKVPSLREEPAEKKMGEIGGDAARKTG